VADARGGPDLEVQFRTDAGLTAGDLAAAWPGPRTGGLVVDGRPCQDDRPLLSCGLVDGAVVTVGPLRPPAPQLAVVAGPLGPTSAELTDRLLIGRGRCCDLRLDHPAIEPGHALVERVGDGWTTCALDGPVLLDGSVVRGPRALDVGAVLSIGPVDLQVVLPGTPAIVPPPHAPVHRAARPPDPVVADIGPPPDPPSASPPPSPPGALTLVGPLAIGVVLGVVVHPTAGLITAAMPLLAVSSYLDARRRHRRDRRRADSTHATALDEHRFRARELAEERATQARTRFPTVADAVSRARRGIDLWTEDPATIAVGWSNGHAPLTTGTGAIGIAGPLPWAWAVARALTLQAVTRAGPHDRGVDEAIGDWTRWLPHRGSPAPALTVEVAEHVDRLTDRCAAMLVWTPSGALLSDRGDGRREVPVRPFVGGDDLVTDAARAMARWRDPRPDERTVPDEVRLSTLVAPAADDGRRALCCPLGIGPAGPVDVDLVADGPHALVAGTTGAGKSVLLRTWVTALARRHPPTAVAFVLVDYKGGTAFDACADLPHVTGVVTDLDPGLGERLLVALRAEVREREAALRLAGVGDVRDLPDGPPRLVVVVDEFATLAAELPDFLSALVDVARRGRSLGLHLVLATQRPAGAVSDDIRANTALRLCLRTLDAADAQDVLGDSTPATLPADRPGRALLRRDGRVDLVQVATTSLPAPADEPALRVRRRDDPVRTEDRRPAELTGLVAEVADAWGDRPRPSPTWLPPLPEVLDDDPGVGLARIDQPAARRQPRFTWGPDDGHLLVVGGRRSGRTCTLLAAVARLVVRHPPDRLHLYAIDAGSELGALGDLPHTGAVLRADDRPSVRRLLGRLTGCEVPTVLVIDRYDLLVGENEDAEGVRLLESVDRLARSVTLLVSTGRAHGLPPALRSAPRLTLRLDDPADYALSGLRPPGRPVPPGRGWTADGDEMQLVAPVDLAALTDCWDPPRPGRRPPPIGPLPAEVGLGDLPTEQGLVVGLRDRDLRPATLSHLPAGPFVVTGPPRSGRTTALDLIAAQLDLPCLRTPTPDDLRAWLDDPRPHAFVLDDAERLADPDGLLRALVNGRHPDGVVILGVRTDAWRSAYGTWLADLRPCGDGLALRPDPVRDAELWTVALPSVGPDPPPGRAVLVSEGRADVIQAARP
jgi:S-DNA-T family DNA segregation ATPase FtsK/SpoIIIE